MICFVFCFVLGGGGGGGGRGGGDAETREREGTSPSKPSLAGPPPFVPDCKQPAGRRVRNGAFRLSRAACGRLVCSPSPPVVSHPPDPPVCPQATSQPLRPLLPPTPCLPPDRYTHCRHASTCHCLLLVAEAKGFFSSPAVHTCAGAEPGTRYGACMM